MSNDPTDSIDEGVRYKKNLERFSSIWPKDAVKLEKIDANPAGWAKTSNAEPNLVLTGYDGLLYAHSQAGAIDEALQWFKGLPLKDERVLFVFGLGLGYFYEAAKEWLHSDKDRFLVFFEPGISIFHKFLTTENASRILSDPQVIIKVCPELMESYQGNFWAELDELAKGFATYPYGFTGLRLYSEKFPQIYKTFKTMLQVQLFGNSKIWAEQVVLEPLFFRNFYQNLSKLPGSFDGQAIFPDLSNKPAIICGAGPTLNGQLELISTLQDKAILFAAGSAANILTLHHIQPHFVLGYDPNSIQLNRALMNYAFETPIFYKYRYFYEALELVHGPRLWLRGGGDFNAGDFFEEVSGLPQDDKIEGLISTSLLAFVIALRMGCNPIILTGMDLSSPSEQRYSKGIMDHPLEDRGRSKSGNKMPIEAHEVKGLKEPVRTTTMWEIEREFFNQEASKAKDLLIVNSTDGGMPIPGIPNRSLAEVVQDFMQESLDIDNRIHSSLQQHGKLECAPEQLCRALEDWIASLERTIKVVEDNENKAKETNQNHILEKTELQFEPLEIALSDEPAYIYYLTLLQKAYDNSIFFKKFQLLHYSDYIKSEELLRRKLDLETERFEFLRKHLELNLKLAKEGLVKLEKKVDEENTLEQLSDPFSEDSTIYNFEGNVLTIKDQKLGLDINERFDPSLDFEEFKNNFSDGSLKDHWYQLNGERHGPSYRYHSNGKLLSFALYSAGKKEGKSLQFYASGKIYSIRQFLNGVLHGIQQYFFEDGSPKSQTEYKNGKLNGKVSLYYNSGQEKRELNFLEGKLQGVEHLWSPKGIMLLEIEYDDNQPKGKARMWHANGKLAKEVTYYDLPEHFDLTEWDTEGVETNKQVYSTKQVIDDMLGKSNSLKQAIEKLQDQINKLKE